MSEIRILKRPHAESLQTQRKFFKKTAKGRVLKVLRERYLRDDISCGITGCHICPNDFGELLAENGEMGHNLYPQGHFILPDTNVFLHQMDLLESPKFNPPIILLQTVMDEVRHRSLPLFNRLKALMKMDEKKIWVFHNEFMSGTAVFREKEETPNDRNDRGIRKTTAWYDSHIQQMFPINRGKKTQRPIAVLLTDDADNRRRAGEENVEAISVKRYVEEMKDGQSLLDVLAISGEDMMDVSKPSGSGKKSALYPEYLPMAILLAGIKSGKLYQGHFSANQYNYLEGTVNVPKLPKPVLLIGREHMNRAVQSDVVVVEVFPEAEWRAPANDVLDQNAALQNDGAEDSDDEDAEAEEREAALLRREQRETSGSMPFNPIDRQPTGKIVGIIKRNWRAYVCHIDPASLTSQSKTSSSQQAVFALPVDPRLPRIRIRTRQAPTLIGQKILVTIDRWGTTSRYPEGHFVRSLGAVESKEAETESLLLEYEVPYRPFGKAVLECLPEEGESWVVPRKDMANPAWRGREDLRDLVICSIDPPGCQDIDDALHARKLPNGNIEAGVHIADVSYFVHPDTPMDTEAAARGTTVYLVDKRIDMLPSLLGTNLCSLRPHVERLAFSAIWELTPAAQIVNVRFTKSVIASKSAFTYEEAQSRKDDPTLNDEITVSIQLLNDLAQKLKKARMEAGALNLASPEVKIHLESAESSDPIDVEAKELRETNSLVEEFMLLANISVARKIHETFPNTAVLRRHLPPPHSNFEKLQDLLKKLKGFSLDVSSSKALADSLDKCVDPNEPSFNTLVRIMATRCMLAAEYFCSGSVPRDTFAHYGLASPIYTHFTSPIRRYADVLAHRQLAAVISYAPLHASLHSESYVKRVTDVINRRHRMAQMAGRASVEFYVGLALKAKGLKNGVETEVTEEAFVIRTFRNGLAVFVSKLGIEGLITFKKEIRFDPEAYTVTLPGKKGDVTVAVFEKVVVRIKVERERNSQRGKVKMTLLSPVDTSDL